MNTHYDDHSVLYLNRNVRLLSIQHPYLSASDLKLVTLSPCLCALVDNNALK